jgi:hypothetical protein
VQTATIDPASYQRWFVPRDVTELRRFLCAGYMREIALQAHGGTIVRKAKRLFDALGDVEQICVLMPASDRLEADWQTG